MAKKKQKSKTSNSSFATYLKIFSLILFILGVAFIAYINFQDETQPVKNTKVEQKQNPKIKPINTEKSVVNAINSYKKTDLNTNFNDIFKNIDIKKDGCEIKNPACLKEPEKSAFYGEMEKEKIHEINSKEILENKEPLTKLTQEKSAFFENSENKNIAKLVIIIDDIATKLESDKVLSIINSGKLLVPSFFPNTSNHPDTNKYAKDFKYFMVHLPLEAMNFQKPEPKTLKTNDSYEIIEARIKDIKNAFKGLKYINNHTGSAFTSDEVAMRRLFTALKKYNLIFVDSRTIASTKGKIMCKEFNQKYIYRNVFLDNIQSVEETKKKLNEAVLIAKKNGYAIAIGHPHPTTLQAIKEYDFKEIKLVSLDEIYDYYK